MAPPDLNLEFTFCSRAAHHPDGTQRPRGPGHQGTGDAENGLLSGQGPPEGTAAR